MQRHHFAGGVTMQANIWQVAGDNALYKETAAFVDCQPKPWVEEVSEFLRKKGKPEAITLVIGQFIVAALFEGRYADLLYWSLVAAEVNCVVMEQWPDDVRQELASHLKRGFVKLWSRNLSH
ncbi:hypothetical protein BPNPMPFG_007846 (plasmid) [Mesorhizobium sp. AR07]|nr:hypothetical protein BPNPMPFG_007846 [Mesorhizobium sp. AR07]